MTLDSSMTPSTSGTTTDNSTGSTGSTADKAKETASTAAAQGQHVAGTAKDEALNVAGTAAQQAKSVVGDATQQVSAQMSEQATTQRDKLSQTLRTFGDDLQQMVEQGPADGMASDLAREVSDRARALGSHLEGREPGQLLDDARDFARRRPGTFLVGALAAGVVAGRLFRATADGAAAAGLEETASPVDTAHPAATTVAGTGLGATAPTGAPGAPPRADFATTSPTLADPVPTTDPLTSGIPGHRTMDTP